MKSQVLFVSCLVVLAVVTLPALAQIRRRVACPNGVGTTACDCQANPARGVLCANGGTCRPSSQGNGQESFTCGCPYGVGGDQCQGKKPCSKDDECRVGNQVCTEFNGGNSRCVCAPTYTAVRGKNGLFCEKDVPCSNDDECRVRNQVCIGSNGGSGLCVCAPTYTAVRRRNGLFCEKGARSNGGTEDSSDSSSDSESNTGYGRQRGQSSSDSSDSSS